MSLLHSARGPSSPYACAAGDEGAEDADISSLLGMLASVTDPRSPQGIQHNLEFVLAVCVVAMLAGAKNYREIAGHAADIPQPLLRKLGAEWSWFRLRYKYPSESTIRNVLTRIDAAELDLITGAWLFARARKRGKAEWEIALDGKVMRGAWTDENDKVTLFSAMLHREAVTIAQVRVPDGTNEITQADAILDTVEIPAGESVLVTLDAAHTQRETAETIGGKPGWDYLMTIKGNQPSLQREVFDRISRCSAKPRTTSRRNTTAAGSKYGPAGSPAQKESTSRTHAWPPLSAVRYSRFPATVSARNMLLSSLAGNQKR